MNDVLLAGMGGAVGVLGILVALPALSELRSEVNLRLPVDRRFLVKAAFAAVAAVLVGMVTGWPAAAFLAAVGAWFGPAALRPERGTDQAVDRSIAIAGWIEQLRDQITAAAGLRQAICASAPLAPPAIREEVGRLSDQLRAGADLETSLVSFAGRVENESADLVTEALSMATERHAADLGALLGDLADEARARASALERTSTARAATRTSVRIIVATALGLLVGLTLLNREYFIPLDTPSGQMVLLLFGGLWGLGLAALVKLSAPPEFMRPLARVRVENQK